MKGIQIRFFEGRVYKSRALKDGEGVCWNCVAADGRDHNWDLCEALRPCSAADRADGVAVCWKQCTALVLAHRIFVVHTEVAQWNWSACCARCRRDLEANAKIIGAAVAFEDVDPCVWECEFCGAGKGEALRWLLTDEGMEVMFHA